MNGLVHLFLILALAYLAYVDFKSFRLPDAITIPLILMGIAFNALSPLRFTDVLTAMVGTCMGYIFLWALNFFYRLIQKRDGIGMGDAKLVSALGAWFGWTALPQILLLASITGVLGGIIWLKWTKQGPHQAFPFGPFLAFAGIIQLLWPQLLPPPL